VTPQNERKTNEDSPFLTSWGAHTYDFPWIEYWDVVTQLSFVWDGNWEHPVMVEYGGIGEPVVDMFMLTSPEDEDGGERDPEDVAFDSRFDEVLKYFKTMCREYIRKER
jgi:hypothetical protein